MNSVDRIKNRVNRVFCIHYLSDVLILNGLLVLAVKVEYNASNTRFTMKYLRYLEDSCPLPWPSPITKLIDNLN